MKIFPLHGRGRPALALQSQVINIQARYENRFSQYTILDFSIMGPEGLSLVY